MPRQDPQKILDSQEKDIDIIINLLTAFRLKRIPGLQAIMLKGSGFEKAEVDKKRTRVSILIKEYVEMLGTIYEWSSNKIPLLVRSKEPFVFNRKELSEHVTYWKAVIQRLKKGDYAAIFKWSVRRMFKEIRQFREGIENYKHFMIEESLSQDLYTPESYRSIRRLMADVQKFAGAIIRLENDWSHHKGIRGEIDPKTGDRIGQLEFDFNNDREVWDYYTHDFLNEVMRIYDAYISLILNNISLLESSSMITINVREYQKQKEEMEGPIRQSFLTIKNFADFMKKIEALFERIRTEMTNTERKLLAQKKKIEKAA